MIVGFFQIIKSCRLNEKLHIPSSNKKKLYFKLALVLYDFNSSKLWDMVETRIRS